MNYKIDDIEIGDEVYFNDDFQNNFDLYWKVIDITPNFELIVEIKEMGRNERWTISIKQVRQLIKGQKL